MTRFVLHATVGAWWVASGLASSADGQVPEGFEVVRLTNEQMIHSRPSINNASEVVWSASNPPNISNIFEFADGWIRQVTDDTNGWEDLYLRELDADLLTSGDGDCDGDIDFADFAVVQQCFTGDARNAPLIGPECYALDFDFDGHVDRRDFADYLDAFTGAR